MQTISICNHKGGVAKTTTAWALAAGLHDKSKRVLLVDLDPQTNLAFTAGVDLLAMDKTLYDVFKGKAKPAEALSTVKINLDILTGGIQLVKADKEFTGLNSHYMMREVLDQLEDEYDYAIIDTPPSLGVLTECALVASDKVIIPMRADIYALLGFGQLQGTIEEVKQPRINPDLNVDGILITCAVERTNLVKSMIPEIEKVAESMGTRVYKTHIRNAIAVSESAFNRASLFDNAPTAKVTQDYANFINEFLEG